MRTYLECIPCFLDQAVHMARISSDDEDVQKKIIDAVAKEIPEFSLEDSPPEMARRIVPVGHVCCLLNIPPIAGFDQPDIL